MKGWALWLAMVLLATPASALDRDKKDKDKKSDKKEAQAVVQSPLEEAEAKLAAGDREGALDALQKGSQAPGVPGGQAALRLGELREDGGELDLAIDAYRLAAEKLEGAAKGEALGRLAVVQDTRGTGDAEATAQAAVATDPEGVWPTIAMSHRQVHEGHPDEAVALAEKAVAAGGGAAAQAALGEAEEAKGDMAAAEAAFRKAMAEDPKRLGPVIGLAGVLRRTNRAAEAEPLLAKVIEASPGAIDAYKEMARVKIALGRPQEAVGDASIAAAMAENDPDAQKLVMEVRVAAALQSLNQGQTDLAVQDLTRLRDENPESVEVRLGLARAQIARRDAAAALVELQKAVELDPKSAEASYQLGYVRLMLKGDAAGAVAPLEKAVSLDPGNATYLTAFGTALGAAGQFDRAIEVLTKATAMPGYDKADGFIALGQAYVNTKRYADAATALEKATKLAPDNAQAWATLGWAYFGLKDADKFKVAAGKARSLGYKEPTLLQYLSRVEAGEAIK
jgi:tetratricopeptide (TPR) repeat protein